MNMSFIHNTNFQQGKVKTITLKTLIPGKLLFLLHVVKAGICDNFLTIRGC